MASENKRTLKKRIRKIVSLCILTTVLLFGGLIIFLTVHVAKIQAVFITSYYSSFIGDTMNSEYFLKQLNIRGLEEFDPTAPKAREWIESLRQSEESHKLDSLKLHGEKNLPVRIQDKNGITMEFEDVVMPQGGLPFIRPQQLARIQIVLNEKEIYHSRNWGNVSSFLGITGKQGADEHSFSQRLLNYFSTESVYPLPDSLGNTIGSIQVQVDSGYILLIFIIMVALIGLAAAVCLILSNIISKLLTISVSGPLNQLEEKIKAIAAGDYKTTINAQITLKKPLREIESLAYSTNTIMQKMKEYNDLLETQKVMLENQNAELEAQNEDLAESKRQIEEAQAMLVQSENMASIGQLTAAITHEINTPLGAINSNTQLFEILLQAMNEDEAVKSSSEAAGLVQQMKDCNEINLLACERVVQIIRSLKIFTKLDQAEFQEADINEGIRSVLVLTSNLWKRNITLHEEYGVFPPLRCYSGLLNQVFMNIIVNAIQSIADKGDIFIRTYADTSHVYIVVRDTGCGIRPEHLPHVFDMGFSTKEAGTGAGLGLSICQNIVNKHQGKIHITSEVGKGTECIISIPQQMQPILEAEAMTAAAKV